MIYPLKMIPAYKDYMWGGTKLPAEYNKAPQNGAPDGGLPIVAESWEVSTHPDGLSAVANGCFQGETLKAVLGRHPEFVGQNLPGNGEFPQSGAPKGTVPGGGAPKGFVQSRGELPQGGDLPVLIKLIDAREPLSLQVHPDDGYAWRVEGESGKNEMWHIVEAEPGAELILGFNRVFGKSELRRLIESGEIMDYVRRVQVAAGECYTIPAGLLHAIGKGIVIAEVQQMSNLTYRVYDYGRAGSGGKGRELHIDKALDVLDTGAAAVKSESGVLVDWEYFKCRMVDIGESGVRGGESEVRSKKTGAGSGETGVRDGVPGPTYGFECLLVTDIERGGTVTLEYGGGEVPLLKGESVFLPAGLGGYVLKTGGGQAAVLSVTV